MRESLDWVIKVTNEERVKFIEAVLIEFGDAEIDSFEVAVRKISEAWEEDSYEAFERGVSVGWSER